MSAVVEPCLSAADAAKEKLLKHKRRFCRHPGCSSIVKSQGLCQRHGAKPRLCKVEGCKKQSQGNFNGMCKAHFKVHRLSTNPLPPPPETVSVPPAPQGPSVYDSIIPESVDWRPDCGKPMPLIQHLKEGFEDSTKPSAWHRNEERLARGLFPVHNPALQLEGWERELVWTEILLLTGNPNSSFRHLARAWGRDKGFHTVLGQFICERHGNVERKKRRKAPGDDKSTTSNVSYDVAGGELGDHLIFGDAAYNEALAADLFTFDAAERQHRALLQDDDDDDDGKLPGTPGKNDRMLSFENLEQTKSNNYKDGDEDCDVDDDEIEEILVSSEEGDVEEEYTEDVSCLEAI